MRYLLAISICFFSCLNIQAAQYPAGDNRLPLSQTASVHAAVSNVPPSAFETYLTPYDDAEGRLLQFLDQAKSRCYIASYSITNANVVAKLIQLHNRGVDVEVVTGLCWQIC